MRTLLILFLTISHASALETLEFSRLVETQTEVERVYYDHRTGTKPPFEQAVPKESILAKLQTAQTKEELLAETYHFVITPAMVEAETKRIEEKTRAPEMLAEIKAACDNDPALFGAIVARPIVVERELRSRFENDDVRHAKVRAKMEALREAVLEEAEPEPRRARFEEAAPEVGDVSTVTWQLGPKPEEESAAEDPQDLPPGIGPLGPGAKVLSSPRKTDQTLYFEDLPAELRNVLAAQLKKTGDISAVIETPNRFLLYFTTEKSEDTISLKTLVAPKQDYNAWIQTASK